jgi:hypothetical protein
MPKLDPKAATERSVRPTIHSDVSLPIFWLNDEWAVTRFGLESVAPGSSYWIDAPRLGLVRGDRAEWPAQIEGKGWTDPRLFVEAFFKALEIHEVNHTFDRTQEDELASLAADRIVAYRELRRQKAKQTGKPFGVMSFEEVIDEEDRIDDLIAEGFSAPDFPKSCVER